MQRRKASKKKGPNPRTRKTVSSLSEVCVETQEFNTRTEASELFGPRLSRRPKTLKILTGDLDQKDLNKLFKEDSLAIDTETGGLDFRSHDLRLISIADRTGNIILIRKPRLAALNLRKLFNANHINFIFHNAAFDLKFLISHLACHVPNSIECTKVLSKILEPNERSGLGKVVKRACNIELDKAIKHTWDEQELSKKQVKYACDDVLFLHEVLDYYRPIISSHQYAESASYYKTALACIQNMVALEIVGFGNTLQYLDVAPSTIDSDRKWWAYRTADLENTLLQNTLDEIEANEKNYKISCTFDQNSNLTLQAK